MAGGRDEFNTHGVTWWHVQCAPVPPLGMAVRRDGVQRGCANACVDAWQAGDAASVDALSEQTLAEEQLAQLAAKVTRRAARELGLATRTQEEERRWRAR